MMTIPDQRSVLMRNHYHPHFHWEVWLGLVLEVQFFWPCVITIDPETKNKGDRYTKVLKRRRNGGDTFTRQYHLQFFGVKVQRAWVVSSNMLKFEGKPKNPKVALTPNSVLDKMLL